ncbi:MAG: hypothetical protein ABI947_26090 [Chloroflexota bacterium]
MAQTVKANTGLMRSPQNVAWIVVIFSFIAFCVMCVVGTWGANWFLFESPVALTTRIVVSRGAVTVSRPDGTRTLVNNNDPDNQDTFVVANTVLQTDNNSQGYLTFVDAYSGRVVGTLFLLENSTLTFTEASRPRFEWSQELYRMMLKDATGHFIIDIPDKLNRAVALSMDATVGVALIKDSGSYRIDALDQKTTVYTRSGKSLLYASPDRAWPIEANMQAVLENGKQDVLVQPYPYDMLNLSEPGPVQPSFGSDDDVDTNKTLPLFWACTTPPQEKPNEPDGTWTRTRMDGQVVLEISRRGVGAGQQPLGSASTNCQFNFPPRPKGLNPKDYSSLSIQLKMKLLYQDVTTCGIVGSECPLMLLMAYVDTDGHEQFWRQGFYAERPPSDTNLLTCDTCPHNHAQINADTWYIYDTGDLKQQFPPGKIDYIEYVEVYSSGHQFEMVLSDFTVLGGKSNNPS